MLNHFSLGVINYKKSFDYYSHTLKALFGSDLVITEHEYAPVVQSIEEVDPVTNSTVKKDLVLFPGVKFANFLHQKDQLFLTIEDLCYGHKEELIPTDYGSPKGVHYSFKAESKQQIQEWYAKSIEFGATCNGAPGVRPMYGPSYYGAFVVDPNGYRLEACLSTYNSKL